MNGYLQLKWPWIEGSHAMRTELLNALSDADLAFNPGGANVMLGALCREMGDVEAAYVRSLHTMTLDLSQHASDAGIESSVAQIKAWYATLDDEMQATVAAFSDEDLHKTSDRSGGFVVPVEMQLDVYLQAVLIFFGKVAVYFRAMNKPLSAQFQDYIG